MKLTEVFDYEAAESQSLLYGILQDLLDAGEEVYVDANMLNIFSGGIGTIPVKGKISFIGPTGWSARAYYKITVIDSDFNNKRNYHFILSSFDNDFELKKIHGQQTLVNSR